MIRTVTGLSLFFGAMFSLTDGAEPKKDPSAIFDKLDANGDGKLSKDEFAKLTERLAKGKLEGKGDAIAERLFEKLDANKDGFLSKEEFAKMREQLGGKLDADKKKALLEKIKDRKQSQASDEKPTAQPETGPTPRVVKSDD